MSRGEGADRETGLWVGPNPLDARGGLHCGVIATLLDVATGYMLVARSGGKRRVTARLTVDYRSGAQAGEWLQVYPDRSEEDGRKTYAHARVMAGQRVVAEAGVLFIDAPTAMD